MRHKYSVWSSLTVITVATFLQMAGVITPMWLFQRTGNVTIVTGLYYSIGCGALSGSNCSKTGFLYSPSLYGSVPTYDETLWETVVWLETISACFSVILAGLLVFCLVGFGVWTSMAGLDVTIIITAACSWLALVGGLVIYIIFYQRLVSQTPHFVTDSFPWSPFMCFIACILYVVFIVIVCSGWLKQCKMIGDGKDRAHVKTEGTSAKRHGLMKHCFPYVDHRQTFLLDSGEKNHFQISGLADTVASETIKAVDCCFTEEEERVRLNRRFEESNIILPSGIFTRDDSLTTVASESRRTTLKRYSSGNERTGHAGNSGFGDFGNTHKDRNTFTNQCNNQTDQICLSIYQPKLKEICCRTCSRQTRGSTRREEIRGHDNSEGRIVGNLAKLHCCYRGNTISSTDAKNVCQTSKDRELTAKMSKMGSSKTHVVWRHSSNAGKQNIKHQSLFEVQREPAAFRFADIHMHRQQSRHLRSFAVCTEFHDFRHIPNRIVRSPAEGKKEVIEELSLAPGYLTGKTLPYNWKYIYRPYSEFIH